MLLLFIVVPLVLVAVGVLAYLSHLQEKKRRETLLGFALDLGWVYRPDKDRRFDRRFPQFQAFSRGHSRYAHNTLQGPVSIPAPDGEILELHGQAGDYHYKRTSGSGKNRSTKTYRFSYLMVSVPGSHQSDLRIRPENLGDKMKGAMGFDDIDFESVEFSDRFWVTSRDKRFAYDVIHPRMMEFLMNGHAPNIEIDAGVLCLVGRGSRWEPHEFRMRMSWVGQFYALWPRHMRAT